MKDSRVLEYGNISFSCIHRENSRELFSLKEHALIYLAGGKLEIISPERTMLLIPGECAFIRKDCHLTFAKSRENDGAPFKAVTMTFPRRFLIDYWRRTDQGERPKAAVRSVDPVLKIPARPDVSSLFQSLMPYFWSEEKPDSDWLDMKMTEALKCLLKTDPNVYASLFDFTSRWKVPLMDFMEENYAEDLSLQDYADYTGRSLSSFNRDFRKAYGVPPQEWLKNKRLCLARQLLRERGCKVQEAMADAGFSNLSYFSRVYKERFGCPPGEDRRRSLPD